MKRFAQSITKSRMWPHLKSVTSTLVFVWFFTHHIAQATMVPTESMVPTILVGDHFMLDKVAYPANYPKAIQNLLPERSVRRGDILAFWSPENGNLRLVKRVIGLPGDSIEVRDSVVYINDEKLDEPYVMHVVPEANRQLDDYGPVTSPNEQFFMMGDNRDNSRDSRSWGFVSRDSLIGKSVFVYWSYESEPHRERTLREWVDYYASVAAHFFTRTRWLRTGTVLR